LAPAACHEGEGGMLTVLINILIYVVFGAICVYLIDKFVRDRRLANLLRILIVLIVILAIVRMLLPALGLGGLL
jgi:ABC-type Co2+ transport system permease subunit